MQFMEPNVVSKNSEQVEVAPNGVEGYSQVPSVENRADLPSIAAETMGVVGEALSENAASFKDNSSAGSSRQAASDSKALTPAQVKNVLLKKIPSERMVRREIEKEIEREIKYLHKKAVKMSRVSGSVNFFEMANILKKMRELREIMANLVKASFDSLKTLWLRFVHGMM